MQVAAEVKNMDGMLLLPQGCELTARLINILQAWGVSEIEVDTSGDAAMADPLTQMPPEKLATLTAELKALFWEPDEVNPGFKAVFQAILRRRVLRGTGN
jgi:hypothetical protein